MSICSLISRGFYSKNISSQQFIKLDIDLIEDMLTKVWYDYLSSSSLPYLNFSP